MAEKKKTGNSSGSKIGLEKEEECYSSSCCSKEKIIKKHLVFLAVLIVLAAVLGYFFRDRFLAAFVNGKPIFRYKLNKLLIKNSGKEALESLIVENLINDEIKKSKVTVTEEKIDEEIKKISGSLTGGMKLEDALSLQGISLADFRNQLRMRLQVNKILEKDIVVSEEEIDKFIKENDKTLTATTAADKRTEAKQMIEERKIGEKIQAWINELLSKAKITRFLK